jgi:hypothetical protein
VYYIYIIEGALLFSLIEGNAASEEKPVLATQVVGSNNPTRSISCILVNYGIGLRLVLIIVGLIQQQCQCRILPFVDTFLKDL